MGVPALPRPSDREELTDFAARTNNVRDERAAVALSGRT
jgi:hypothetical protein